MAPTYTDGEYLFIDLTNGEYRQGDVILFHHPFVEKRILLKRIDKLIKGNYYVVGDDRTVSTDSRSFGEISNTQIIGSVCGVVPVYLHRFLKRNS